MNGEISPRRFLNVVSNFSSARILVVGDFILDQFLYGIVRRISPEAPVPVVELKGEGKYRLGGAGNTVNNLVSLGARVAVAGVVGNDKEGEIIVRLLENCKVSPAGIFRDSRRVTSLKTRVITSHLHHQVVRLDREKTGPLSPAMQRKIIEEVSRQIPRVKAVIISDYDKGLISRDLMERIISRAQKYGIWVGVDPKPRNFPLYRGVSFLTPNHYEASQMVGFELENDLAIKRAGEKILTETNSQVVLITRGEKGMNLLYRAGAGRRKQLVNETIFTGVREVFDVTGAGDTVIATFTLALCVGANFREAAILASLAAGVVVGKPQTATVSIDELKRAISSRAVRKR